jgi:hypothetical protein
MIGNSRPAEGSFLHPFCEPNHQPIRFDGKPHRVVYERCGMAAFFLHDLMDCFHGCGGITLIVE